MLPLHDHDECLCGPFYDGSALNGRLHKGGEQKLRPIKAAIIQNGTPDNPRDGTPERRAQLLRSIQAPAAKSASSGATMAPSATLADPNAEAARRRGIRPKTTLMNYGVTQ